jgi:hypothetical protein
MIFYAYCKKKGDIGGGALQKAKCPQDWAFHFWKCLGFCGGELS